MRKHWSEADEHIKRQIVSRLQMAADGQMGALSAMNHVFACGYDISQADLEAITPLVTRMIAAKDEGERTRIRNTDSSRANAELMVRKAWQDRRKWAAETSIEDDQAKANAARDLATTAKHSFIEHREDEIAADEFLAELFRSSHHRALNEWRQKHYPTGGNDPITDPPARDNQTRFHAILRHLGINIQPAEPMATRTRKAS